MQALTAAPCIHDREIRARNGGMACHWKSGWLSQRHGMKVPAPAHTESGLAMTTIASTLELSV